ncbi:hypothetical protein DRJ16_06770 [Candidatus Woesearchaeota archaeon]|nr:MAG: hypothetical protein DRJ16_06770 [Candidatus Woesearchaeota archaeon]
MPKYRNDSGKRLVVGGQTLEPNQVIETPVYQTTPGLTKIADEPFYSPVLLSERISVSAGSEVSRAIPETDGSYIVDITVESGVIEIRWNKNTATPYILSAGRHREIKCFSRIIDEIFIKGVVNAVVDLNVTKS